MANIKVAGLQTKKLASGRIAFYWTPSPALRRAGWTPLKLGTDMVAAIKAAEARNDEIATWRGGGAKPRQVRKLIVRATVDDVIRRYREARFRPAGQGGLAESTQKVYASGFRVISAWAGAEPVAAIDRKMVRLLRDALIAPDANGKVALTFAHATLRQLRTLLAWAVDQEIIAENPAERFDLATPAPRDHVWWAPAREAIVAAADAAGRPNMALALELGWSIGQREGDLLKLLQSQYVEIPAYKMDPEVHASLSGHADDGRVMGIRIRQGKTSRWIEVPVVGELRGRLEAQIAAARRHGLVAILFDEERGNVPWAAASTKDRETKQNHFQKGIAALRAAAAATTRKAGDETLAAEIETLQFRDLRRTCVVILGELGLADHLIAAITGHTLDETKKILETYMPRTTGMAARAIMMSAERDRRASERKAAS